MTRTGVKTIVESEFFTSLASVDHQDQLTHDIMEYLQTHVFSALQFHTIADIIQHNKSDSKVMTSLMVFAFNSHLNLLLHLPQCKEWLIKELLLYFKQDNQMGLLLQCFYRNHHFEDSDEFIIEISNYKYNPLVQPNAHSPELIYIDTMDTLTLLDLILFCDFYDLRQQGIYSIHVFMNKITINQLFEVLEICREYNPDLLELSTCFGYLTNRIFKYWMMNMTYSRFKLKSQFEHYISKLDEFKLANQLIQIIAQEEFNKYI